MKALFHVYEIEHHDDVNASVDDLRRAGCWQIEVISMDFDAERMTVRCELPAGCEGPQFLALEVAVL